MSSTRIVGILLVQNEEKYIQHIIRNILGFCDEIIVADNLSSDSTAEKVKELCKEGGKVEYHSVSHPRLSHGLITRYVGTKTWVFGVDGDELYDPAGLQRMRRNIMTGHFDDWWMILGNVLHCIDVDFSRETAHGYLAPPCRSMTKLYNFEAITSWAGPCPERLHGGVRQFKDGYAKEMRLELYKSTSWEESDFRCLHLCFQKRSSRDQEVEGIFVRKNISDMNSEQLFRKIWNSILSVMGKSKMSDWKRNKYMRGQRVTKNISSFLE